MSNETDTNKAEDIVDSAPAQPRLSPPNNAHSKPTYQQVDSNIRARLMEALMEESSLYEQLSVIRNQLKMASDKVKSLRGALSGLETSKNLAEFSEPPGQANK